MPGVIDVLSGRRELSTALKPVLLPGSDRRPSRRASSTHARGDASSLLAVLPAGPLGPDPAFLVGSPKMTALLEQLKNDWDFVLVDAPPLPAVDDGLALSASVDGVLVVTRSGLVPRRMLQEMSRLLDSSPAEVLGFVLTGLNRSEAYGYGYGYGSGSGYGGSREARWSAGDPGADTGRRATALGEPGRSARSGAVDVAVSAAASGGGSAVPRISWRRTQSMWPGLLALVSIGAVAADQGGYFPTTWGWTSLAFLWVAGLTIVLRRTVRVSKAEVLFLFAWAALLAWIALSTLWSTDRAETVLEVERTLVYVSAAAMFVLVCDQAIPAATARWPAVRDRGGLPLQLGDTAVPERSSCLRSDSGQEARAAARLLEWSLGVHGARSCARVRLRGAWTHSSGSCRRGGAVGSRCSRRSISRSGVAAGSR